MGETALCLVCGDIAVGKNYGALSCFGCKAFFQRSVRKCLIYACRFDRDCPVERKRRNQCRYCRFQKCLRNGMKKAAVQDERDKTIFSYSMNESALTRSRSLTLEPLLLSTPFKVTVSKLLEAESLANLIGEFVKGPIYDINHFARPDGIVDLHEIKRETKKNDILFAVEWAKHVPSFTDLDRRDQLALLWAHAGELLVLDIMKRSINAPEGVLVFSNGFPLNQRNEMTPVQQSMLDFLKPLKSIQISDREIICLKALVLLDPNGVELREPDRVKDMRYQVQLMFEDFIKEQPLPQARGRLSRMLLTLLPLYDMRSKTQNVFKFAKICGIPMEDSYIEELVNNDTEMTVEAMNFIRNFYWPNPISAHLPLTQLSPHGHLSKESLEPNYFVPHANENSFQLLEAPDDFSNVSALPLPAAIDPSNSALIQAVNDILEDDDGIPPDLDFEMLNLPSPATIDSFISELH